MTIVNLHARAEWSQALKHRTWSWTFPRHWKKLGRKLWRKLLSRLKANAFDCRLNPFSTGQTV